MGFFSGFTDFFEDIVQSFAKAQPLVIAKRGVIAFSTGGVSEILRTTKPTRVYVKPLERGVIALGGAVGSPFTGGLSALAASAALAADQPKPVTLSRLRSPAYTTFQPNIRPPGGQPMALNIGGILSGVGGLFGGVSAQPYVQGVGQIISALAPAFTPAQNYGPVYSPTVIPLPQARQVSAMAPIIGAGASAVARMTAPILFRISSTLGRRVSLTHAITIIRKMGKMLMNPVAIGTALGISLSELATLITAHSSKKSRRMNPANGKALRRAAHRIKGFHKMCGTIDLLKSRGRRHTRAVTYCK